MLLMVLDKMNGEKKLRRDVNFDEYIQSYINQSLKYVDLNEFFVFSFHWASTKEGHDFWREINQDYERELKKYIFNEY